MKTNTVGEMMSKLSEDQKQKIVKYLKNNSKGNPLVAEIYVGKKSRSETR